MAKSASATILQKVETLKTQVDNLATKEDVYEVNKKVDNLVAAFTELEQKVLLNMQQAPKSGRGSVGAKKKNFPTINQWFKQNYKEDSSWVKNYLSDEVIEKTLDHAKQDTKYTSNDPSKGNTIKQREKYELTQLNFIASKLYEQIKLDKEAANKLNNDHKQEKANQENSTEEATKE